MEVDGAIGDGATLEVDGGAAGARTTAIAGERERERGLAIGSHYDFAYERGFCAENCWGVVFDGWRGAL